MRSVLFISIVGLIAASHCAWSSTGELYGYGSHSSALANTMLGGLEGGYGTFYNPAANSALPGIQLSYGISYAHPSFLSITNVTVANNATTAQPGDVVGNVDTGSYLDHLGQVVGASLNFGERLKNLTLGATAFMPLMRVAYLDSGEAFKPEYFSYRSRTQRPQIYGSASVNPIPNLYLGTGLAVATNLSGTFTAFVTGSANSVSYQRLATTIKPSVAPYFSIYADPKPFQAGMTVRLPNTSKVSIDTTADARLLGPTNDLPLIINSSSSLYYDPLEVDVAAGYQATPAIWATAELDWIQYKAFESPTLTVTDLGSGPRLQNSINTIPSMRNIFVPKIGVEYLLGEATKVRAGYFFRQSPVVDNSGPGNLIDPPKHVFTAGVGINLQKANVTSKELTLDMHVQYHYLVHQHVVKSANNEVGISGQTKVGAPGYDTGGSILGGGLSLSMAF